MPTTCKPAVKLTPEQQDLVARNMGLVGRMVGILLNGNRGKLLLRHVGSYDDCLQVGFVALCRAARGFDPALGFKFSTYACRAISSALGSAIGANSLIRTNSQSAYPEHALLALGWVTGTEGFEEIPEARGETGLEAEDRADQAARLWAAVDTLPPESAEVLRWRFRDGLTLSEIGRRRGRSKERVRQWLEMAFRLLRRTLEGSREEDAAPG